MYSTAAVHCTMLSSLSGRALCLVFAAAAAAEESVSPLFMVLLPKNVCLFANTSYHATSKYILPGLSSR